MIMKKQLFALALLGLPMSLHAQAPVAADTPARTDAGVSYTQPKDWTVTTKGAARVLAVPEANLDIAVIDVGAAAGAEAAAAKAWLIYKPGANRKVRLVTVSSPGEGWDERVGISYETSPSDRASVSALALRKGTSWTVMITAGAEATVSKRFAALNLVQQSLRPAGYAQETFAGKTAHRLTPARIDALRAFVADAARTLEVPGVGMALIDGGKVVWQGGVGVRALGSAAPVMADTKFMIASNTKGMATLLLSVLADEGKLRWDQPVTELYPAFRLGDDATTRATLVRHLVCACTGLPRKDYAFILGDANAPAIETFRGLATTQPTSKFGELFQYNNLMASAAGYLGGMLAYPKLEIGAAFDKAMETRIFTPLGMRNTTFDYARGMHGNWARPHGMDVDGRTTVISNGFNTTVYPHRPAGGAWSTAADMARYVQLELGKGVTPEGKRLVSEANILERRKRGVPVGENNWYGMGLFDQIVNGLPVVTHGGTLLGYRSNFWALPEAGVGAVILTNSDSGAAMLDPFFRRLLEVLYDGKPEAVAEVASAAARTKAEVAARRSKITVPGDARVLAGLASRYNSPEIGDLTIRDQGGTRWIRAGVIDAPLATRTNADKTVSVVTAGPGAIGVEALVGTKSGLRTLTILDSQHEYVYTEVR
jgi:CubicO group peptidase (beta-lactamase class C family)